MADTQIVGSVSSEDGVTWKLHPGMSARGLKGNTAYRVRPVGPELNVTTLAALGLLAPTISPNPLQAGKPGSITFSAVPEDVGGNIALTASEDGLTYTFMVPEFGSVFISATSSGYEPFQQTYIPDSETIEAVAVPVSAETYAGQTVGDIPNIATYSQTSNYTRTGRTIVSAQLLRNGQPATLTTVLAEGDAVDVLVTDSAGGTETFLLTTVQFAVDFTDLGNGFHSFDFNSIMPDDYPLFYTFAGVTTETSEAELAEGPVNHIPPKLVKENGVYSVEKTGEYLSLDNTGPTTLTHRPLRNGSPISGATTMPYTHVSADDTATITVEETATDASGTTITISNPIVNAAGIAPGVNFINQYESDVTAAQRTFSNVDLGGTHAQRDILVLASNGNTAGATITGLSVEGVAATKVVDRISSGSGLGYVSLWKARVPTGASGSVVVDHSVAAASCQIAILAGANVTVSASASKPHSGVATTFVTVSGATPGQELFAFAAGLNGATTWTGDVARVFDEQAGTINNGWATLGEGVVPESGTATATLTKDNGLNSQFAMIIFAAGAAA